MVTSDAGLLAYRELDDALGLTALAGETLADARTGKNGHHAFVGLLRQSVFGRLAGYEDVNHAERLRHDQPCDGSSAAGGSGPCSFTKPDGALRDAMARGTANLSALSDLSGQWIDIVHGRRPPKGIVLDMDSSVSPTHGEHHGRYVVFQMAEVAIPRQMCPGIVRLSRNYGRSHRPRQHEAFDCHAFKSQSKQEECVQMPVKIARSTPRPSFGLPEPLASTPRVSLAARPQKREYSRQYGVIRESRLMRLVVIPLVPRYDGSS